MLPPDWAEKSFVLFCPIGEQQLLTYCGVFVHHDFRITILASFMLFMLMSTVAHNFHIKTKCSQQITKRSHQIQIAHIKFKSLTANSNRSQQIQIAHSKLQIAHSKFKSPTANSNRSQQIKVAQSKFKLLTNLVPRVFHPREERPWFRLVTCLPKSGR